MVRVLLVDDHTALVDGLEGVLGRCPNIEVTRAGTLSEARRHLKTAEVVVVSLELPRDGGITLIQELRQRNPEAKVLVRRGSADSVTLALAVEAGASGVIDNSASIDETVDAVERLVAGDFLLPPDELAEMFRTAARYREDSAKTTTLLERLTDREREVLEALCDGLSDKEIADRLRIGHKTVRTHVANLLPKLAVHSRLEAVVLAYKKGLVT